MYIYIDIRIWSILIIMSMVVRIVSKRCTNHQHQVRLFVTALVTALDDQYTLLLMFR